MSETPDHPADMTILVKTFGTTSGEVGMLRFLELVNLSEQVTRYFVRVQLVFLSLRAWLAGLRDLRLLLRCPLRLLHGHLSAVFGSVDAHACTLDL